MTSDSLAHQRSIPRLFLPLDGRELVIVTLKKKVIFLYVDESEKDRPVDQCNVLVVIYNIELFLLNLLPSELWPRKYPKNKTSSSEHDYMLLAILSLPA